MITINPLNITCNGKPFKFVHFNEIQNKKPHFEGQTQQLGDNHSISIWYVESEDTYYGCLY